MSIILYFHFFLLWTLLCNYWGQWWSLWWSEYHICGVPKISDSEIRNIGELSAEHTQTRLQEKYIAAVKKEIEWRWFYNIYIYDIWIRMNSVTVLRFLGRAECCVQCCRRKRVNPPGFTGHHSKPLSASPSPSGHAAVSVCESKLSQWVGEQRTKLFLFCLAESLYLGRKVWDWLVQSGVWPPLLHLHQCEFAIRRVNICGDLNISDSEIGNMSLGELSAKHHRD